MPTTTKTHARQRRTKRRARPRPAPPTPSSVLDLEGVTLEQSERLASEPVTEDGSLPPLAAEDRGSALDHTSDDPVTRDRVAEDPFGRGG